MNNLNLNTVTRSAVVALLLGAFAGPVLAQSKSSETGEGTALVGRPMLLMPVMDPVSGRALFAEKGCVVCHSINGIGGEDAPAFDDFGLSGPMDPFEFAARMWQGAPAMIMMQEDELGGQIDLTGPELADIIAFVHSSAEKEKFSEDDIPEKFSEILSEDDD